MKKFLKRILPKKLIDFLRIKAHEKAVLKSDHEDHVAKQRLIQLYAKEFGLKILIETGTYVGRMVQAQRPFFDKIISIELSPQLHEFNKVKFRKNNKVTLLLGDSALILRKVIAGLGEPALFWLDGHYSGGLTAKGELNTPILNEISYILQNKYNHCILIDDARLFNGNDDYPEFELFKSSVLDLKPHSKVAVENDVIVITYAK